jgi:hypothetical protein
MKKIETKKTTRAQRSRQAIEKKLTVSASLRNVELTKATSALNLILRSDGEKLGELSVGRGSFFWYGRNSKKRQRITWTVFADLMDDYTKRLH